MTEAANDFRYVDLNDVDPNFTLLDPEVYDLIISKAELRTYQAKTANATKGVSIGDEGSYVSLQFTVANHPKFSGRKHFESIFFSPFTLRDLRRLADATGVQQAGTMENWLTSLSSIQPMVKLKVDLVDDGKMTKNPATGKYDEFVPNPRTVKPDGTASKVNKIDWRAGIQSC